MANVLTAQHRVDLATEIAVALRQDGWANVWTGIGVEGKDKRKGGVWCPDLITTEQCRDMWRASAIASRIVSTWPKEMLREGWCLSSDNSDFNENIEDRSQELGIDAKFRQAMEYQRAYGGGAILLGINDGSDSLEKPLNIDGIISFDFVTVLEHRECIPYKYYNDPNAAKYGEPAVYQIGVINTGLGINDIRRPPLMYVHESRLIIFDGERVTRMLTGENYGWGDSVFVRCNQALADFEAACAAVGILVTDFAPNVFKMKNLLQIVAAEGAEAAQSFKVRMQALALGKSIANTAVVDADDDYKRETVNVTGLAELWDRLCVQLAAIADMPVTLLMGQSPKGLGNEGESDMRFFYDRVKAKQKSDLYAILERVVKLIAKALKLAEPSTWEVKFHPLYQPSEKEQAETRETQMRTDTGYIASSVYSPDEIRKSRGDGTILTTHVEDDVVEAPPTAEELATLRDPNASADPAANASTAGGSNVQQTAFNGTQISGAMDIIKAVVNEEIARESGLALLTIMFPISTEQATTMLGPENFKPKKEPPPPMAPGFPPKPNVPPAPHVPPVMPPKPDVEP